MRRFKVVTKSFAAPFFSDTDVCYVWAWNAIKALEKCVARYDHPCGLYSAAVFKGQKAIASWICNHAKALEGATMILSHEPGDVEIDGVRTRIEDPKGGRVYVWSK